jgi:hypothetical protein
MILPGMIGCENYTAQGERSFHKRCHHCEGCINDAVIATDRIAVTGFHSTDPERMAQFEKYAMMGRNVSASDIAGAITELAHLNSGVSADLFRNLNLYEVDLVAEDLATVLGRMTDD